MKSPSVPKDPHALTAEEAKERIEEMLIAGGERAKRARRKREAEKREAKKTRPRVYLVRCRKCPAMKVFIRRNGGKKRPAAK